MGTNNYAETWQTVYQVFQQINFSAFDYNTVKQSLVDYIKLYYSEDYSDLIETSDLIMQIELFAYIAELVAYRSDLNAHENFISLANRKESVLRLATMLSYSASRNIAARGLVKITSVSTTAAIYDANGNNLSNTIIYWNDSNNTNWLEQFILVLNSILDQSFGTVLPSDRIQVQDVLFELYGMNNQPLTNQVIPYSVTVSGIQYPMELVSAELNEYGPYEKTPQLNQVMNIMYLNDGLGNSSNNTGFFFYTKQGQLTRTVTTFDGVTPNQVYDVNIENTNETDVWLNNINASNGAIITTWEQVDSTYTQNVLFNTSDSKNLYQIETLDNDEFALIFGDGNFSNIPSGTFEIWSRASANLDLVIPVSAIQNIASSMIYLDSSGNQQTFSFTFSLIDTIQNAAPTEDKEHISQVAPAVYNSQNRMVNGSDYNGYMLQDNTILKMTAINRTFAGDSRYIPWNDPTQNYCNVKMYGNDLAIYFNTVNNFINISSSQLPAPDGGANVAMITAIINNYLQPLLSNPTIVMSEILAGATPGATRKAFNASELLAIQSALTNIINFQPSLFFLTYAESIDTWQVSTTTPPTVWIVVTAYNDGSFNISYNGNYMAAHSDSMQFWVTNNGQTVLNYDTLNNDVDTLTILQANVGTSGILTQNYNFNILSQDTIQGGANNGVISTQDLIVIPEDTNGDGIPDNITLSYLINPSTSFVYFSRTTMSSGGYSQWTYQQPTTANVALYNADVAAGTGLWKREIGTNNINFLWLHITPNYHLIDPCPSNLIDMYIITRGYYTSLSQWLTGITTVAPQVPSQLDLRNSYGYLLENAMLSDTCILSPGNFQIIIGSLAPLDYQGTINVVQSPQSTLTANQIKTAVVDLVVEFMDITTWEFGETFYFTELSTYIHTNMPNDISSVVIVPLNGSSIFGDLFEVTTQANQIIQASITVNDIQLVSSINPRTLQ